MKVKGENMDFICPTCGEAMERDILNIKEHTEKHIIDEIKREHPDWASEDGICKKCFIHYKEQMGQVPKKKEEKMK